MIPLWIVTLLAAAVQGATGFGFSMIIVPVFAAFLPDFGQVTVIAVLCSLLINLMVALRLFRRAQLKSMIVMTLAAFAGIPLGVALLAYLDENILKLCLGIVVALTGALMLFGVRPRPTESKPGYGVVGFISGFLNGTSGLSGPPVILFMAGKGTEKDVFRANLAVYGVFINVFTLLFLTGGGFFTSDVGYYCLGGLPLTATGVILGMSLSKRIPEKLFRRVAVVFVTALGAYTAAGALISLA